MMISRKGSRSQSSKVLSYSSHSLNNRTLIPLFAALEKTAADEEKGPEAESDDNAQTIKANRSPGPNIVPLAKAPSADMNPIVEDYSDLAFEEDELDLENKVADFKLSSRLAF